MKESVRTTLTAVRRPTMRRPLLAFLAFSVAEWAVWLALLIWAYDRSGVGGASLVSVVQLVPAVVVAPLAAAMGDRMHRGRALALGYLLQSVSMAATAAALAAELPLGVVATCGALVTCAVTLTRPVHNAALPSLARTPGELMAGNAVSSTAEGVGAFLGPLSCGLIIVHGGAETVFAVFGLMLLGAAALVVSLPAGRPGGGPSPTDGRGPLAQATEGVRELRRDPPAAVLVGMVAGQYIVVGALDILVIMVALEVLETGASGPGVLASAVGVGSVLGALCTVLLVGRRRLSPALAGGLLVTGVPLALLPFGAVPATAALLLALSGAGRSFFEVAAKTLLQRAVRDEVLARVFGVQESAMTAAIAVGAALAPLAVAGFGLSGALVLVGALLPVAAALSWRWLRRLDITATQPGAHLGLLRGVPSLRLASPGMLEGLSRAVRELRLPAGTMVVREGDAGELFYVVAEGELVVSQQGRELRRLGPGDSFGEIALLRDVPRTATVEVAEPALVVALARPDFLRVLGSSTSSRTAADAIADNYLDSDRRGAQPAAGP